MEESVLEYADNRLMLELCGAHDRHLVAIESALGVTISHHGAVIRILGGEAERAQAVGVLNSLYDRLKSGKLVDAGVVDGALRIVRAGETRAAGSSAGEDGGPVEIRTGKRSVEPRTPGQIDYVKSLLADELVFGVGPAGTGKTYLAVAVGVSMFVDGQVDKIILSRPAVEAGERLGFLPGDMKEKIDPYLRPLYDAIHDLWPGARIEKLMDEGRLEVAPLAFMRGRTLSNAFVVLDEAQNATEMQMRMFLTRLGENSRMVVTGDPTQVDLPRGVRSGLIEALDALSRVKGVSVCRLGEADVVRHKLVARIVRAYQQYDEQT